MNLRKLQKPIAKGGLGLPNMQFYYYAFSLRHLAHWALPPERAPPWYLIEQSICTSFPPLLFLTARMPPNARSHPIITHLQEIWRKVARIIKINPYLTMSSGIWDNPKLLIGKSSVIWKEWVNKGILTLSHLYEGGILKSFGNLVEQFDLANNQFWRYLQLRHLLVSIFGSPQASPQGLDLLNSVLRIAEAGHEASQFYSMLINTSGHNITTALKAT